MASLPDLERKLKSLEAERDDILDRIRRAHPVLNVREWIWRRNELNDEISKLQRDIWNLARLLSSQDVNKIETLIDEWELEHQGPFDNWIQIPF